jgi:hypothetical protein
MKRLYWIFALLLVLSLALAACGSSDEPTAAPTAPAESAPAEAQSAESAPAPTLEPTAEPTAVPTPEPTAEPQLLSLADLRFTSTPEQLDSYRYEMVISATGTDASGAAVNQTMTILMAYVADPPAMSISMSAAGDGQDLLDLDGFEMVQMGGTNYMVMGEFGCLPFPAEEDLTDNPMLSEFSPENMFGDLSNIRLVGEEDRAGLRVLHYQFDEASLPAEDIQDIKFMNGDLYISKEGGFLVSMIIELEGNAEEFLSGLDGVAEDVTARMEFNLKDINQPIEITLPAGCEEQTATSVDWPLLEDAADIFNMFGMVSYTTAVSLAEATEFYQNAMADLGYTYSEEDSFAFASTAMLVFKNSDGTVSINISEAEGETSVTIFAEN